MKDAQASNWVVEIADATSTGFVLKGSSKGYTSFRRAFDPNTQVFTRRMIGMASGRRVSPHLTAMTS